MEIALIVLCFVVAVGISAMLTYAKHDQLQADIDHAHDRVDAAAKRLEVMAQIVKQHIEGK